MIVNNFTTWALSQSNIEALIQFGSRAQENSVVDQWSDWDFHVICKNPKLYVDYDWPSVFGVSSWNNYQRLGVKKNSLKTSLILENGTEVDLVLLSARQIKFIYYVMRQPFLSKIAPFFVRSAIFDLNQILSPGYKILKGGLSWEMRLKNLSKPSNTWLFSEELNIRSSALWQASLTITKAICRDDLLYAIRVFHRDLCENIYPLLLMTAEDRKITPHHEFRYTNRWLTASEYRNLTRPAIANKRQLSSCLLDEINFFDSLINTLARNHQVKLTDHSKLKKWIKNILASFL